LEKPIGAPTNARALERFQASHHRFLENQETIEEVLGSQSSDVELDRDLRKRNLSLRAVVREIPPVFASI
jgi:hypothetical protein